MKQAASSYWVSENFRKPPYLGFVSEKAILQGLKAQKLESGKDIQSVNTAMKMLMQRLMVSTAICGQEPVIC